jgi:hypothetical protein
MRKLIAPSMVESYYDIASKIIVASVCAVEFEFNVCCRRSVDF